MVESKSAAGADAPFAILDMMSATVLLTDTLGRVLWGNSASEVLLGCSRRTFVGTDFRDRLAECDEWYAHLASGAAVESARVFGRLLRAHPGAQPDDVRVQAVLTRLPEGWPACRDAGVLIEIVDVEETLHQDREWMNCELMDANRQLLRNLAHEIKNPLGGIRGAAQLLESDLVREEDRECTSVIIGEADRLQALVDRFLAPYRQKAQCEEVNVHEVLEHVRSLVAMEFPAGLSFVRDYDISAPNVRGDRARLTQVFLNIVRNAAEVMDGERAEGRAAIVLRTRIVRDVMAGTERVRMALAVDIIDNGPGVPVDMQEKIFYPLVTGRAEGSGLGLSLAQTFVRQAGGTITLESVPGRTVFRVLLPFSQS